MFITKILQVLGCAVLLFAALNARADENCSSTYNSSSGEDLFNVCVSVDGNIPFFESPFGQFRLLAEEGYAIATGCGTSTPVTHGYDAGKPAAGFGPSTVVQPNGANTFPLTITRDTTDGVFRLQQSFSRDTTNKGFTITMKLTNLSSSSVSNVFLTRYFTDAVTQSRFIRTVDSVSGWLGYGLMLTDLTFSKTGTTTHSTVVQPRFAGSPNDFGTANNPGNLKDGCFNTSSIDFVTPSGQIGNGWAARVIHQFPSMSAGSSKTVKFVYRRF
jgi:hypothetical protein